MTAGAAWPSGTAALRVMDMRGYTETGVIGPCGTRLLVWSGPCWVTLVCESGNVGDGMKLNKSGSHTRR
jgi:hypothetical protein